MSRWCDGLDRGGNGLAGRELQVVLARTQGLLEHSMPQFTNEVYTNVDPALRQAIGQLPVVEWM